MSWFVQPAYNPYFLAYFFSQNNIFLSQKISRNNPCSLELICQIQPAIHSVFLSQQISISINYSAVLLQPTEHGDVSACFSA
jgi:hypothetical protein